MTNQYDKLTLTIPSKVETYDGGKRHRTQPDAEIIVKMPQHEV